MKRLVVYHGTDTLFDEIDINQSKATEEAIRRLSFFNKTSEDSPTSTGGGRNRQK